MDISLKGRGSVSKVGVMIGLLSVFFAGLGVSAAQNAPVYPDPGLCIVAERSIGEVILIASGLPSGPKDTEPETQPAAKPSQDDLAETVIESIACVNGNSPLQWLALFSQSYIVEHFGPTSPDALGSLQAALTRSANPADSEDRLAIIAIVPGETELELLVTTINATETFEDRLTFVWEDGLWLIDEVEAVDNPNE